MTELDVADAWRLHHPETAIFSGPRPRRNRLDYIFVSESLLATCYQDSTYEDWEGSDHRAHQVNLTSWHHPTGPGFWRLSDWLVRIPQLRADIQQEAKLLLQILRDSNNPGIVWKSWKQRMKMYLKKCQRSMKTTEQEELIRTRQLLEESAAAVARDGENDRAAVELHLAKQAYERSKEEWLEFRSGVGFEQMVTEAERSSSFFFRAPRFVLRNTPFRSINLPDGSVSNDPAEITCGFQHYWGKIFGDVRFSHEEDLIDVEAQNRLLDSIHRKLTREAQTTLEIDITGQELASSIRPMRGHSAPGPDRFTTAFYQVDPDLFGEILAIISDTNYNVENYCPISDTRRWLFSLKKEIGLTQATFDLLHLCRWKSKYCRGCSQTG